MSSRFASLITITDLMHKVDQKLNIIISPKYRQHVINMDEKERVFKYILRCNNKKEFYQFYLGVLPPNPRDLTLYRPKYDKKGGEYDTHPLILRSSVRRSGRFPALPYPPNRQQTIIKTNSIHQGKFSTGEKK